MSCSDFARRIPFYLYQMLNLYCLSVTYLAAFSRTFEIACLLLLFSCNFCCLSVILLKLHQTSWLSMHFSYFAHPFCIDFFFCSFLTYSSVCPVNSNRYSSRLIDQLRGTRKISYASASLPYPVLLEPYFQFIFPDSTTLSYCKYTTSMKIVVK